MGGISIILLSFFLWAFIGILFVVGINMLLTYIFESISFRAMSKALEYKGCWTAWIPFYHKYIFGKIAGDKILGKMLVLVDLFCAWIFSYCYFGNRFTIENFRIFFISIFVSFVLNSILAHKIFKKTSPKARRYFYCF